MVRDDSWIANMDSAIGSNQSDTWSPQKKLLEAEIEKLRETNKNQRVEMTKLLQQQGRLEATAEQERMALESAYSSALDEVTRQANEVLESESQYQSDRTQYLLSQTMAAQEQASGAEIAAITNASKQHVANLEVYADSQYQTTTAELQAQQSEAARLSVTAASYERENGTLRQEVQEYDLLLRQFRGKLEESGCQNEGLSALVKSLQEASASREAELVHRANREVELGRELHDERSSNALLASELGQEMQQTHILQEQVLSMQAEMQNYAANHQPFDSRAWQHSGFQWSSEFS